jgi:hypothetical protein
MWRRLVKHCHRQKVLSRKVIPGVIGPHPLMRQGLNTMHLIEWPGRMSATTASPPHRHRFAPLLFVCFLAFKIARDR